MFLGGVNFALHYLALQELKPIRYWRDSETRWFFMFCAGTICVVALILYVHAVYPMPLDALRYAAFQVISIITTTGYTTAGFTEWPLFLPILLMYISFIGGCAGSTSGGMKVIRVQLLIKQALREIKRLIHPRVVQPIRIGGRSADEDVIGAVWAFFALYAICTAVITMLLIGTGMDTLSAFSAVAATLNVMGPGLGMVASNVTGLTDTAVWILTFTMLLGRLEIFTVFVLLTPAFWRT
jgi:trk system potassium uptake protein